MSSWKILAAGNSLRKDDGVALRLADEIKNFKVIKAESVPENFVNEGDRVVLIDAVDFGGEVGEVQLIGEENITHTISTTHKSTSLLFAIAGEVKVIGIQVKDVGVGEELSEELEGLLDNVRQEVEKILTQVTSQS